MQVVVHQIDGATTMRALPLAAGLLVATARAHPALAQVEFELRTERRDPDVVVDGYRDPDVLAFSCYAWNERYSFELARRAKARFPRALTVFGGPSIPRRPDRARAFMQARPWIDVLVFGEGELTFRELLLARADAGGPLETVAGSATRRGHDLVFAPSRPRMADFGETVSPYLAGTFDQLIAEQRGAIIAALCETNRGCPFSCTFCDWGAATASRVHELPLERVKGELDWIAAHGLPYIYIVDANFGIRRRDLEITRHAADLRRRTGLPAYVYFHLTKNAHTKNLATVETLRAAGIGSHVALSMQDFEPDVLSAVRRTNIRVEASIRLREECNARGIATFNELILGLPAQTLHSFAATLAQAITPFWGDWFNLYLCRLLENAELASDEERARHGLVTRLVPVIPPERAAESEILEREEIVVATSALPPDAWLAAYKLGYFVAATYNLGLLHAVVQYLRHTARIDVIAWYGALLAAVERAPAASALGAVAQVLEGYARAIEQEAPTELPSLGGRVHGGGGVAVEAALWMTAIGDVERFLAEVEVVSRAACEGVAPEVHADLFRFQRALTVAPGDAPREVDFAHDWLAWYDTATHAGRDAVVSRATRVRIEPPAHARTPHRDVFLGAQLGALYARAGAPALHPL